MKKILKFIVDLLIIFLGTSIYAFGLVTFNMPNQLAEGGVTGITLIFYNLYHISPAISTLILNIPLILIGLKVFGVQALIYTLFGTLSLSMNILFWQELGITVSIDHDLLIAALLAGLFAGVGSGIIYKVGGTTGGTDIVAKIIEKKFGITIGKSLLMLDVIVLLLSLSYISLKEMMYTLIAVFVFSLVVDFVQKSGYSSKGIFIISDSNPVIAQRVLNELERGCTYLKSEGAYSENEKNILFCVASLPEINHIKEIAHEEDNKAFISVLTVSEVLGEGFSFEKMEKPRFKRIKRKKAS